MHDQPAPPEAPPDRFDVVVVGGGAAGVAAAVGAAQDGARVCLLERHGYLGGAAAASSVLTYCGFFDRTGEQVVAGVGDAFLRRLDEQGLYLTHTTPESGNKIVLLDLETTKRALDSLVVDAGVTMYLHAHAFAAASVDGRVEDVQFVHAGGRQRLRAASFVDCSGDGTLLAAAGAGTRTAPPAHRQASTLVMRVGSVHEDADLSQAGVRRAVSRYRETTGVELTRDQGPAVRLPLTREVMVLIADQHRDALVVAEVTAAEVSARRDAYHYLEAMRRSLPGWQDAVLAATGPELGVRESRHLLGTDTLAAEDVAAGRRRPGDVVARGGWPMEDHVSPGRTTYGHIRADRWYDIPFGALRSVTHENLWAGGRLLSCDPGAYSSARVMGTSFATGQACGVAAARHADVGPVAVTVVQDALRRQGALL